MFEISIAKSKKSWIQVSSVDLSDFFLEIFENFRPTYSVINPEILQLIRSRKFTLRSSRCT